MTVSGFTLISRILGFLRDMILMSIFGVSMTTDAFFAAFRFPNMFRRIFGEGAFNAAFVPLFGRKLDEEGKPEAMRFARNAFSTLMSVLGVGSVIAILGMEFLMMAVVPGFQPKFERDLTNTGKGNAAWTVEVDTQGAKGIYIELEGDSEEIRGQWAKRIKFNDLSLLRRNAETGEDEKVSVTSGELVVGGLTVSGEGGSYLDERGNVSILLPAKHGFHTFQTVVEVQQLQENADVWSADLRVYRNDPGTFDLTVKLSRIMFCYLLFMALAAHLSGVLNTFKSFAMPAAAPIILNLCLAWGAGVDLVDGAGRWRNSGMGGGCGGSIAVLCAVADLSGEEGPGVADAAADDAGDEEVIPADGAWGVGCGDSADQFAGGWDHRFVSGGGGVVHLRVGAGLSVALGDDWDFVGCGPVAAGDEAVARG